MNPLIMPSQPSTTTQIIKTAYQLSKTAFAPTLPLYIMVVLMTFASQLISHMTNHIDPNAIGKQVAALSVTLILLYFVYAFLAAAIYRVQGIINKSDPGFKQAVDLGFKKAIPVFIVGLLYALAVLVGLVLLIVPGIMVSIYFVFSMYLLIIGHSIIDSFKESYRLVKNHWWFTTLNIGVLILILIAFVVIFYLLILLLVPGLGSLLYSVSQTVGSFYIFVLLPFFILPLLAGLLFVIIYLYSNSFMLVCLYDLALRKSKELTK